LDPFRLNVITSIILESDYFDIDDSVEFSVEFDSVSIIATISAIFDSKSFMEFSLENVFSLTCWFAAITQESVMGYDHALSFPELAIQFSNGIFNASCTPCSSSGMAEISSMVSNVGPTFSTIFGGISVFLKDMLVSDYFQSQVDQWLVEADGACPSNFHTLASSLENEEENAIPNALNVLTLQNWDFVALAGVSIVEFFAVIILTNVDANTSRISDPFSGEKLLESSLPANSNVLNLSEGYVDTIIQEVSSMLNPETGSNTISKLLGSALLDSNGMISFSLNTSIELGGAIFTLDEVLVSGLDSLTKFTIEAIGPHTLQSRIGLENLSYEIRFSVDLPTETGSSAARAVENISFGGQLDSLDASLALLLAVDLNEIGESLLGSWIYGSNVLPCFLSALYTKLDVTEVDLSIEKLIYTGLAGFSSISLENEVANITEQIFSPYRSTMDRSLPKLFAFGMRGVVNSFLKEFISDSCPAPPRTTRSEFIDFRYLFIAPSTANISDQGGISSAYPYGDLVPRIKEAIDTELLRIDPDTSMPMINKILIAPLTSMQSNHSGTLLVPGDLFSLESSMQKLGFENIEVRIYDARMENLDSVGPVTLLQPAKAYLLENNAVIGTESKPLRAAARLVFSLAGDDIMMYNDVDVSLELEYAEAWVSLFAMMVTSSFMEFPVKDITNIHCWLASISTPTTLNPQTLRISNLGMSISEAKLKIKCRECTSPGIEELAENLSSSEASTTLTYLVNLFDDFISRLLEGDFVQGRLDDLLYESKTKCSNGNYYDSDFSQTVDQEYVRKEFSPESGESIVVIVSVAVSVIVLYAATRGSKIIHTMKRRSELPEDQAEIFSNETKEANEHDQLLNEETESLLFCESIPLYARLLVPLVVIANIGFFLSGHLSLGASVIVDVEFAGEMITIDNFFDFSMAQSITQMWEAGAKELAIIIIIFSGIWPYTKQCITLALWCIHPRYISVKRRGEIFVWLDALAKWSMIDIFMLVISLAAFRASLLSPNVGLLPDLFYSIEIMVVPKWGLYANMIAQLISQVSSHFIIYYHQKVTKSVPSKDDLLSENVLNVVESSVSKHKFVTAAPDRVMKLRNAATLSVVIIGFITVALILCGCALPSFQLRLLGIIGLALEAGKNGASEIQHSLFSVVELIMDQAQYLNDFSNLLGLASLSTLFILTVLLMPILQLILMLVFWLRPMSLSAMTRQLHLLELIKAWQYSEVFLLTVLVTTLQLGEVSTFMVNDYCNTLENIFDFAVQYNFLDVANAQCFYVNPELDSGFYVLLLACCLLFMMTLGITKITAAVISERKEKYITALAASSNCDDNSQISVDPLSMNDLFAGASLSSSSSVSEESSDQLAGPNEDEKSAYVTDPTRFFGFRWLLKYELEED